MTDEQIMQLVKDGNLSKAAVLFTRYNKKLYNFFLRQTYDQGLSEDLTQNVFERMIRYRTSYNIEHSFKSWIYQIARNVKFDTYKKKKLPIQDDVDFQRIDVGQEMTTSSLEKKETLKNLEQAISKLNPEQRELIHLTKIQKMKYSEVASLLETTEGAVKVKVYRAVKELRKIFLKIDVQ